MIVLILLGLIAFSSVAIAQDVIEKGDQAEYSFRSPLTNGMGVKSLAELAGKPILIEFWGNR